MSNLSVKIHKNVDFSIREDIEQEHAITSNEFSSILAPAIRRAWMLAHSLGHGQVLVEHFITALFAEEGSRKILERHGFFDEDGEKGQVLTKRRSGFGAPTFDQLSVSPGKLLPSPHLDAWFRAARDVARTREVEHVTLVVDDFLRAIGPNFRFADKQLAAETAESLEFVRTKLNQQGSIAAPSSKTYLIGKIDEVGSDLRGEVGALSEANAKAAQLLADGLQQLGLKVDEAHRSTSAIKSEIDASLGASNTARSREAEHLAAGLHQLGLKVDEVNLVIPAAKSQIDASLGASDAARSREAEHLAAGLRQLGLKVDEVNSAVPAAASATNATIQASSGVLASEVQRLTAVLHQLERKVDELNSSVSAIKSEVDASMYAANTARSNEVAFLAAELGRLGDKMDAFNPRIAAVKSEVGANISAMIKHHIDQAQTNLSLQFRSLQDGLTDVDGTIRKHLATSTSELLRERRFGRTLHGFLPILAIIAGLGIGVVARMTFGPL